MTNIFGKNIRVTTFGESHGRALGVVIDGFPPGILVSEKDIQKELDRRKPGQSKITSPRKEPDKAEILSGIFEGKSTGTPIAILIANKDAKSSSYANIKDVFRPGHADMTYMAKYGIRDFRGGGRSSGRETVARVAAGALAKKLLEKHKVSVIVYTKQVGHIHALKIKPADIEKNSIRCPDLTVCKEMEELIMQAKSTGDSIGGIVEVIIKGCPAGLGDPVFDKIDADLAKAMLSIGAVKGIEFGAGFAVALAHGSQNNDSIKSIGKKAHLNTNNAGGIIGGITTGDDIIFRIPVKPTPSISIKQKTVSSKYAAKTIKIEGRHDPCICPRIVPVVEAMTNLVIADALLEQRKIR